MHPVRSLFGKVPSAHSVHRKPSPEYIPGPRASQRRHPVAPATLKSVTLPRRGSEPGSQLAHVVPWPPYVSTLGCTDRCIATEKYRSPSTRSSIRPYRPTGQFSHPVALLLTIWPGLHQKHSLPSGLYMYCGQGRHAVRAGGTAIQECKLPSQIGGSTVFGKLGRDPTPHGAHTLPVPTQQR